MSIHPTAIIARRRRSSRPTSRSARTRSIGAGRDDRAGLLDRAARRDRRADDASAASNQIFQFASIGAAPQDLKYKGEPTRLEIGDRNVFRENCTINRGTTKDQLVTRIGSDNLFMTGSHVGHDCVIGSHCVFANYATLGGHVQIGDWVHMGGFAGVHQFCKVGAHAFIANNTAVTRDVPPFVMAVGRPAEPHSVNAEGLKRRGFTAEQIRNIRDAYRDLYRSGLKLVEATEELDAPAPTQPELAAVRGFLNDTTPRRERVGIVR